jgi:hypothetical protein
MRLQDVSDEIVHPQVMRNDMEPILTLVSEFPNIQNIMARPDDPVDPVLQKEIELVKDSLMTGVTAEVPSTPYLTKAQKRKATKATYSTRSQGPPPTSQ